MQESIFYTAEEVQKILGVSQNYAYKLIRQLNKELEERGYITVAGKVSKIFFNEKIYGKAN